MKKLYPLFVLLLLVGTFGQTVEANSPKEIATEKKFNVTKLDVDEYFQDINGTFILRDVQNGKTFVYNKERANMKQTPESTFKIANALIGLQTGAVKDEYDIKYWDGIEREFESWNQDHTLGSAMRDSVIWYYQAMARDIGEQQMHEWLQKISYGNQNIKGGIDQFWLDSSLKITPMEQMSFMENLYIEDLPFDKPVMKTVKRMIIQEEGDFYTLYGKTGTRLSDLSLGWFVGFIKTEDRDYVFVTNLEGTGSEAKTITLNIFKKYNLLTE
ncbi:class D beta-lactamase [Metabacillus elymi]|uniref:Beta-lactamase n=1 Tax=Metabacillus elymi TaxID=2745198 RepID=A0ABX6RYF1_9BACI|nr:class D beta-lactamase [Metabacillus sp. KUDC1714]QNF26572.1 class D beta-lactamase [Metabacillus sp. KUDC1714]